MSTSNTSRFPRLTAALKAGRITGRGLPTKRTYRPQYDETLTFKVCGHCGSTSHTEDDCSVKEATLRILEGYKPRGATAGFECPNGHGDGIWHWGPRSESFKCEVCGVLVDPYSGERVATP